MKWLINNRPVFLEKNWFKFILLIWFLLFSYSFVYNSYRENVDVSNWYEIRSVLVLDAKFPGSPSMIVDRSIYKEVRGEWIVNVMKKNQSGDFYIHCIATGRQDYSPNNVLPEMIDLDWWTWPTQCYMPPGEYYISTLHIFYPNGYPPKESRIKSNIFKILD